MASGRKNAPEVAAEHAWFADLRPGVRATPLRRAVLRNSAFAELSGSVLPPFGDHALGRGGIADGPIRKVTRIGPPLPLARYSLEGHAVAKSSAGASGNPSTEDELPFRLTKPFRTAPPVVGTVANADVSLTEHSPGAP
jgi:hypothetical protein